MAAPTCEVCGNSYARAFTVDGPMGRHTFDCFECAIHALAPVCGHCGCKIIGHGIEQAGEDFCCEHCARQARGDVSGAGSHAMATSDDGRGTTVGDGRVGGRDPEDVVDQAESASGTSRFNVPG